MIRLPAGPWVRHTIDDTSRGADGVRLADVTGDGRPEIVTPWEEGGVVRLYLNPGPDRVHRRWPAVTVGQVGRPEDAVLVDLDGDGMRDVVSCSEGDVRTVWAHWALAADYGDPAGWQTQAVPAVAGAQQWMYCLPMDIDGVNGLDLVIGAKGEGAQVGWLESPANPRDLAAWRFHPMTEAGWVMSLLAEDMDGDGDDDVILSDRKGARRGCWWLENPGPGPRQRWPWTRHEMGGEGRAVMFAVSADLDADGLRDVVVATGGKEILFLRRTRPDGLGWRTYSIAIPELAGTGKAVAVGDIDLDGQPDIVFTCEHAEDKSGVMWLSYVSAPTDTVWDAHDISGEVGVKFDLVQLYDLDEDGDLDVLTCEERANLGVVWYENPTRP